ncbi:MAG: response regulator [Limisphaerales bacterium]
MTKRILLADDDASIREALGQVLELEHYDVVLTGGGCEAVAKLRADLPDLVLLDLDMPDQNGWQTFDAMRHVAPRVPVLIITAVPHQAKRAAQLGAAALMEKPLHLPRLVQILSDLLAESVETRRARTTGKAAEFDTLPAWPKAQPSCTGGTC